MPVDLFAKDLLADTTKKQEGMTVNIPEGEPVSPQYKAPEQGQIQPPESLKPGHLVEPAATIATGMVAEPIAGLAGLASAALGNENAYQTIQDVRGDLTYIPRTEEGMRGLEVLGDKLAPIGNFLTKTEQKLGEKGYNIAGPVGGALGQVLPTIGLIAVGQPQIRNAIGAKSLFDATKNIVTPSAKKLIKDASPTIEGLKDTARGIYSELGNSGVVVNASSFDGLRRELNLTALDEGFNATLHPRINAALSEFNARANNDIDLKQIDILRQIANDARISNDASESRLGSILIDRIDSYLDGLTVKDFRKGDAKNIGSKYKDARQLWQRVKKSELLTEAFNKADLQASGFENGLRIQFRSILNNKNKMKGFTPQERKAMEKVVKGGPAANIAKALGKFGFSDGQSVRMLMPTIVAFVAGASLGTPAAIAVPVIGQVSQKLAVRLTRGKAEFADALIRAGKNGDQVVRAYLLHTPAKQRDVGELTELLMRPDIDLKRIKPRELPENKYLLKDAVFFADFIQSRQKENQ
jgi:hypothetical protein